MADITKLGRVIGSVTRNVDLSTNTLVLENVKLKFGTSFYVTFAGTPTANRTITAPDANVDLGNIAHLITLSGVAAGSNDLGTFSGITISDNATVKSALQELETALEAAAGTTEFADNLFRVIGSSDPTKKVAIEVDGLTTATTRTITMPDANVNLGQVLTSILQDGSRAMAANLSMGNNKIVNLANGTNPGDAINYAQLQSAMAGLDWQPDVDAFVADGATQFPGTGLPAAATGQRYIIADTSALDSAWGTITGIGDNDIVQYDGADWVVAYDVSAQGEGALVWNREENYFMRWDGTDWSEFGGLAGITAGAGLDKSGNVLFIELDTTPGLEFDTPGDAGKLRAKVDGSTIERHSTGLRVKAAGITGNEIASAAVTETHLATSVAGNGLTGGGGAPLAVGNTDNSLTIAADTVSVNSSPRLARGGTAGESFTANVTVAVRMGIPDLGETANRMYKADPDASSDNKFYVIGIVTPTGAISAGGTLTGIKLAGGHSLGSGDTNWTSTQQGRPFFLGTGGAITATPPSADNTAVVKLGMVQDATNMTVQIEVVGIN